MNNEDKLAAEITECLGEIDPLTRELMLTQWAIVGYFEPLGGGKDYDGRLSVTGSGNAPTTVGLLRMGEFEMNNTMRINDD